MRGDARYRIAEVLKYITYKPGWTFEVVPKDNLRPAFYMDEIVLRGVMMVPSLDREGHPLIPVVFHKTTYDHSVDNMTDADIILYLISGMITEMENHERDEWLKYRGFHVRDPHPEQKKTSVESFLSTFVVDRAS